MNMVRMTIAEAAYAFIAGDLPTGEAVKVTAFYDLKSATSPVLTTNTATEIGATGKYYWCLDGMETSPAAEMIVLWIMTAPVSGRTTWGVLHIGGYPGTLIDGAIRTASFAAGAINAAAIAASALDNKGNWSKAGDEMDLLDAPNATAVAAIQEGLATSLEVGAAVTAAEAAETAAEAAEAEAEVISTMLTTESLAPNAVVFVRPAP